MSDLEVWQNAMASITVIFLPLLIIGAIAITAAVYLSDKISSNMLAALVIIAAILLVGALGVSWIATLARPCGYIERHFPTEEHISGYCEPVRISE